MYEITEESLKLVWKVLNNEFKQVLFYNPNEKEDIFQVGCIGLVKASKKFDSSRGFEFSTFAYRLIKNELSDFFKLDFFKRRVTSTHMDNTMYDSDDMTFSSVFGYEEDYTNLYVIDFLDNLKKNLSSIDYEIISRRIKGKTILQIANEVGMSYTNVQGRLEAIKHYIKTGSKSKFSCYRKEMSKILKKDDCIRMYEAGFTYTQIAEEVNSTKRTIERWLQIWGIAESLRMDKQKQIGIEISKAVMDKNKTFKELADKYNISEISAKRYFNKYGEVS